MNKKKYKLELRIQKTRKLRKMSQKELAKKIGTTQSYISKLERNLENPTVEVLYKIADALIVCPRLLIKRSTISDCSKCKCCVDLYIDNENKEDNLNE